MAVEPPMTKVSPQGPHLRYSAMLLRAFADELVFRPVPPGDEGLPPERRLALPRVDIDIDATEDELAEVKQALAAGALTQPELEASLQAARVPADTTDWRAGEPQADDWSGEVEIGHALERLSLVALKIVDRAQSQLLHDVEPLTEIHFRFSDRAKAALAVSWEGLTKRGQFPLPPRGTRRFADLDRMPRGAMHFVSASDLDSGYLYTMGIALSPEAQALGTMDFTYGLDGELIVPGQAVSPIPPFLAMATRLFAASIPTSSNISEEVQSIPMRNFAHPTAIDDLEPRRGGRLKPPERPRNSSEAITDLRLQLSRYERQLEARHASDGASPPDDSVPPVGAAYDVTGLNRREIVHVLSEVLEDPELSAKRVALAPYLDIEPVGHDRVATINEVVDAARELGLRYVAVADDDEDSWLPNLLEYLEPDELNAVADHADEAGIIVIDGRPVDPVYTAATAAQRIQSVFTTLSVDILKMGMWLCLDALAARRVWREIISNPHIPQQMLLMPIGIVEPWDAFVDNRDTERTARPILDAFEKIKFMIEEAATLGMPSLLTDTRHKATWVLLGRKTPADEPHPREQFVTDPRTGEILGRTNDSAIPLLSWEHLLECERLARRAGVFLGQAGSIEIGQAFRLISDVTYDAARDGANPATAFWTAETERVLRTSAGAGGDLQSERGQDVSAFLASINRAFEAHARVDGWLRYLAESDGGGDDQGLRDELAAQKTKLDSLIDECLASQADAARYQPAWDAFRDEYLRYHRRIRDSVGPIRERVASRWSERGGTETA
jgi:hypothetical protein